MTARAGMCLPLGAFVRYTFTALALLVVVGVALDAFTTAAVATEADLGADKIAVAGAVWRRFAYYLWGYAYAAPSRTWVLLAWYTKLLAGV